MPTTTTATKNKGMRGCFRLQPQGGLNSGGEGATCSSRSESPDTDGARTAHRRAASSAYCAMPPAERSIPPRCPLPPDVLYISTNFGGDLLAQPEIERYLGMGHKRVHDFNQFGNNAFLTGDWRTGKETENKYKRHLFRASGGIAPQSPVPERRTAFPKNTLRRKRRGVSYMFVGVTGFEPATLWSQTRYATGLRYTPKQRS